MAAHSFSLKEELNYSFSMVQGAHVQDVIRQVRLYLALAVPACTFGPLLTPPSTPDLQPPPWDKMPVIGGVQQLCRAAQSLQATTSPAASAQQPAFRSHLEAC